MSEIEKLILRAAKRGIRTEHAKPGCFFRYLVRVNGNVDGCFNSEREMKTYRKSVTEQEVTRLKAAISTLQKAGLRVLIRDK